MSIHLNDVQHAVSLVLAVAESQPERQNPRAVDVASAEGAGFCLYQTPPPFVTQRCLIGEVAHQLGWPVPDHTISSGAIEASTEFEWPVSTDVARALGNCQQWADASKHTSDEDGNFVVDGTTWGEAAAKIRTSYEYVLAEPEAPLFAVVGELVYDPETDTLEAP